MTRTQLLLTAKSRGGVLVLACDGQTPVVYDPRTKSDSRPWRAVVKDALGSTYGGRYSGQEVTVTLPAAK